MIDRRRAHEALRAEPSMHAERYSNPDAENSVFWWVCERVIDAVESAVDYRGRQ